MPARLVPVIDGLAFAEGPRWHEGRLWFSDMHSHVVMVHDPATGETQHVVDVPGQPSGLGWRPDGTMLVVSMTDRRVLAFDGDALTEVADLSDHASFHCNDMVVDRDGNAYVGNFGFDLYDPDVEQCATTLVRVGVDGDVRVVADGLWFPNGMVITPDDRTLVVGESFGGALTAFTIEPDGSLGDRREWARVKGSVPDGICLDADGAIWMASPINHLVLRVAEGGEVLDTIETSDERHAFACMLGGPERTTLYVCTAVESEPAEAARLRSGKIEAVDVEVPGAGLP